MLQKGLEKPKNLNNLVRILVNNTIVEISKTITLYLKTEISRANRRNITFSKHGDPVD
jgi:hypothetical protein